jgi:molecular chaperone HscB
MTNDYLPMSFIMNYFELYNLPITLHPDPELVKKNFYALSRKYHPDFYTHLSDEEQADALEKSSMVNQAYRVLQHPDETIKYVLQLKGLQEEEEKYQLSPDFLMEVMDLNEQALDVSNEADMERLDKTIVDFIKQLYTPVEPIILHYQDGVTTEKELLQVKEYYYRKKYLDRILAGLK